MKRIAIAAIVMQIFVVCFVDVVGAAAMWDSPRTTVQAHQLIFLRVRDEYQLRYAINGLPSGTHQVRANFWSTTGTYYDTVFENPTGIAYLTCNGTYIFEVLDSSGQTISETTQIKTTKINAPACKSYENAGLKNELGATISENDNGGVQVFLPENPIINEYEFYHNGELVHTEPDTRGATIDEQGFWTIVGKDANGDYVGSVDFIVGGADGIGGDDGNGDGGDDDSGSGGGCDACKWLTDALACPAWDEYMGELTDAIRDALPPPTNWDEVASTFVDHFSDYFGNVPVPPTKEQINSNITPPQPTLDISVPDAELIPQVPSDFNDGPLDTDITTGEQIEIVDESEAFDIYEPDAFIDSDPHGVMVFPNDPRNHSGGIKEPDTIDTGYPIPTPQPRDNNMPEVDIPTPSSSTGTMPTPSSSTGTMPTPQPIEYEMPIPKDIEWEGS